MNYHGTNYDAVSRLPQRHINSSEFYTRCKLTTTRDTVMRPNVKDSIRKTPLGGRGGETPKPLKKRKHFQVSVKYMM